MGLPSHLILEKTNVSTRLRPKGLDSNSEVSNVPAAQFISKLLFLTSHLKITYFRVT